MFGISSEAGGSRAMLYGALGAALFMMELAVLDRWTHSWLALPALVPPFGASVVIVFFTPDSPAGRPWNVVVGQTVSAFAASSVLWLWPAIDVGLQAGLSVGLAGTLMFVTRSFHPPGGATALLAVVLEEKLGFAMMLCPMLVGAVLLVVTRYGVDLLLDERTRVRLPRSLFRNFRGLVRRNGRPEGAR